MYKKSKANLYRRNKEVFKQESDYVDVMTNYDLKHILTTKESGKWLEVFGKKKKAEDFDSIVETKIKKGAGKDGLILLPDKSVIDEDPTPKKRSKKGKKPTKGKKGKQTIGKSKFAKAKNRYKAKDKKDAARQGSDDVALIPVRNASVPLPLGVIDEKEEIEVPKWKKELDSRPLD